MVMTDDLRCDNVRKELEVVEGHHVLKDEFKQVFWEQQVATFVLLG